MANDLTTSRGGGYLASSEDYYAALAVEAQGLKGGGAGKAFMKFDGNTGEYSYGADDEPLYRGDRLAVNMKSYQKGWVIWVDGEVVFEEMHPLGGPTLTPRQLPDHGPYGDDDGPVEQYTIDFRMVDEPHTEMVFQANNSSKRRALAALLKDFANLYKAHPGQIPIIEIDDREFETTGGKDKKSKRKYKKYAPVFKIVDWMNEADLIALSEGDEGDYEQDRDDDRGSRRGGRDEADDRGSRRSAREEDDAPRGRGRSREDDEPRSRGRGRGGDDEDRGSRRGSRDEADEPRSRGRSRDAEDEAPATRRGRRDEPEAEPEPATRRGRSRDDAGEPEADEAPATRRRANSAEAPSDDDAPPRRSRSRDAEPEAEPEPATRRGRREEREEEPATRRGGGGGRGRF